MDESPDSASRTANANPFDIELYDFRLPDELIAQTPALERDQARMLVLDRSNHSMLDRSVRDLVGFLKPNDLLVLNDTRVVPARVLGRRTDTGGRIEVFFLRFSDGEQEVLLKTRGAIAPGITLTVDGEGGSQSLTVLKRAPVGTWTVRTGLRGDELLAWLGRVGRTPLPPYIRRKADDVSSRASDATRYQTVYASAPGAVAAPTAGLHLTDSLLRALGDAGVRRTTVTLHVGLGTFRTVSTTDIREHQMHSEWFSVSAQAADDVARTRRDGGRIVAVGTTSVRALESAAREDGVVAATSGETRIFIHPPYRFRAVDALMTNFHVPKSTLLMLVSAFAGREFVLEAYKHAVRQKYRLLSFGDAMLIV